MAEIFSSCNAGWCISTGNTDFYAVPLEDTDRPLKAVEQVEAMEEEPQEDTKSVKEKESVEDIHAFIARESEAKGIDPKLVEAVIKVESKWDSGAIGDNGNSLGLMQIQPRWHKARMDKLEVIDLLEPQSNVRVGIDILAELTSKYGLMGGLQAYNTGDPNTNNGYAERVMEKME